MDNSGSQVRDRAGPLHTEDHESAANESVISLRGVSKNYPLRSSLFGRGRRVEVRAVQDVSLDVRKNETLALVGESGSGKTTLTKLLLRLEAPSAGVVLFRGRSVQRLSGARLREYRSAVQAVFQDPFDSLNPRMKVRSLLEEPLIVGSDFDRAQRRMRVRELLDMVKIPDSALDRYPHEFSGGQVQRIAIARSLALQPELIVLDEPISKLDVSIGAQIMNLLRDLQERLDIGYLFIAHNLATVRFMADRVAVMYLGKIVEYGRADTIFSRRSHPYTEALFTSAEPFRQASGHTVELIRGEISSATDVPIGCLFHPRCPKAMPICERIDPPRLELDDDHEVDCWLYDSNQDDGSNSGLTE